jgi:hypothetical protein
VGGELAGSLASLDGELASSLTSILGPGGRPDLVSLRRPPVLAADDGLGRKDDRRSGLAALAGVGRGGDHDVQ